MTYQKIPGPFLRDAHTNKLTDQWSTPEFDLLQDTTWVFTEKVDGTNIRVIWDGYRVSFAGRTDNAEIPPHLLEHLETTFGGPDKEQIFEQKFGSTPVVLYGEGYGPKINGGGKYREDVSFVLFDVNIEGWWLLYDNIVDIADYFGIDVVPLKVIGSLNKAIRIVRDGMKSYYGDFLAEGLVGTTVLGLKNRKGDRIIVKVKTRDLHEEQA